jgi:flavodoxin
MNMNSVVIYASRHDNTRRVAEAVANELRKRGEVHVFSAEHAPAILPPHTDLVVVGGPTEAHRMMEPVAELFDRFAAGALAGKAAAAFDTRLRWPVWLSGSAAAGIVKRFERAGARVIAPQVSFFVTGKLPELEPGELTRASAWAASLPSLVETKEPVASGL